MALTVTGFLYIQPKTEILIKNIAAGSFFNFNAVSEKYRGKDIQHYRVAVFVPKNYIDDAEKRIQPGKQFGVRMAELKGTRTEKGTIFNQVFIQWKNIDPLAVAPVGEKPEHEDYIEKGKK